MLKHSMFIVVEGSDGVGKTSTAKALTERFVSEGINALYFREPGGNKISEKIRKLVLSPSVANNIDPNSLMLMMFASRYQLFYKDILPFAEAASSAEKRVVIVDRFFLSTLVYQVMLAGANMNLYEQIQSRFVSPDYLVLLNCDFEIALQRQEGIEGRDKNAFDSIALEKKKLIHSYYTQFIKDFQKHSSMPKYYSKEFLSFDTGVKDLGISEIVEEIFNKTKNYWEKKENAGS